MNLKDKIEQANKAYRLGNSIISDKEYDELLEQYKKEVSSEEFEKFIKTLNEGAIEYGEKIKHPYIMGSLSKLKYETPAEVKEFIDKYCNSLNVSAKVDGISCRLHYENGKLTSASTRGDGYEGISLTDKIAFVGFAPNKLGIGKLDDKYKSIDVRGELVILKRNFCYLKDKFANPRNAVAGIINRKDWNQEDVSDVSFIAYTILGQQFTKEEQFALLSAWGFKTAWNQTFRPYYFKDNNLDVVEELFKYASQEFEYETDGLVICDAHYRNEDKYRPDACKAFKINQLVGTTRLVDVSFEGPSKNGLHVPVAVVDPVNLGGATITRCTLHNLDFINEKDLKYGSKVRILRSGDVIPKIIEVVENDEHCAPIELPLVCNCCGSPLVRDGVNLRCINKNCTDQVVSQIALFIKNLGVKSASEATLKNFNITSFEALINFNPDKKYKSQVKLYDELSSKMFTRSFKTLFCNMTCFEGIAETTLEKIYDFYGYDKISENVYSCDPTGYAVNSNLKDCFLEIGLPAGVGEATLEKFQDGLKDAWTTVNMIIHDTRWNDMESTGNASCATCKIKGSICVTGSLKFGSRNKFLEFAKEHGYESKTGVTKDLTYLVTNDTKSGSSKNCKAKELGVKVISEDDFMKLINDSEVENSLDEL